MWARNRLSEQWRRPREVTGRMVFICLVAFFGVVAGANAIMVRAAVSTFGGVETESAYQAGLAFAREAAAIEAQDAMHWQVRAKISAAPGAALVEISVRDASDRPLAGLEASARLVHPTDKRLDEAVVLDESMTGVFRGRVEPVVGHRTLVTELSRGGTVVFRSRNRVFLSEAR